MWNYSPSEEREEFISREYKGDLWCYQKHWMGSWDQHYNLYVFQLGKKKRKEKKKEGRKEKVPGLIHWAGTGENLRGSVCILQCAFICAFYMCPLGTAFWTISVSPSLLFLLYFSFYFHSLWGCLSSHISFFPRLKRAVWIGLAYFHSFLAWAGISSIYVSWYGLCAVSQGKIHLSDSCSFH